MRRLLISLIALLPLVTARAEPGVNDEAKFFKPETVQKANADLKQIKADYGKELVIDTFAAIPDSRKAEWEAAKDDAAKRAEFFASWVGEAAHEKKVNGVYGLIVKDPGHLEVEAGAHTRNKAFTPANRDKMRTILLEAFKTKDYDEGLEKAVDYFRNTLRENVGPAGQSRNNGSPADEQFKHRGSPANGTPVNPAPTGYTPRPTSGHSVMWVILVIIGAFLLIRILSSLGGPRNYGGPGYGQGQGPGYGGGNYGGGNYGPGYGSGGGGGGFFRNILGGMLGGAAGSYLYDRYRDSNQSTPQQGGGYTPDNTGSSGGDFGSSSSSSSDDDQGQGFGGGGSSGDFGGSSDSGGGGSDSGGGGDSGSSGGDF